MKFKVYAWFSGHGNTPEFSITIFELVPSIAVDVHRSNFEAEDMHDGKAHKGTSVFVILSWLFFGITFDFRFGDDAREDEEAMGR